MRDFEFDRNLVVVWSAVTLLFGLILPVRGADNPRVKVVDDNSAALYFGYMEAPCATQESSCDFITKLRKLTDENSQLCPVIDEDCKEGVALLHQLFGPVYRDTLPDFIVYLDDSSADPSQAGAQGTDNCTQCCCGHEAPAPKQIIRISKKLPLLMWRGRNTPHILGASAIYVIAFSNHRVDASASVTSLFQYQRNPFIGIFTHLKAPGLSSGEATSPITMTKEIKWLPISGRTSCSELWVGIARLDIQQESVNRITVIYQQPKAETPKTGSKDGEAVSSDIGMSRAGSEAPGAIKYEGEYLGVMGHFSNSSESYVAASLSLGSTFNTQGTSLSKDGSSVAFNGFVFAKFYLPHQRPYLNAAPRKPIYHPSWGIVLGTNVNGDIFDEIVLGVSRGNLIGKAGLIAGVNYINGKAGTNNGRQARAYIGLEYTF